MLLCFVHPPIAPPGKDVTGDGCKGNCKGRKHKRNGTSVVETLVGNQTESHKVADVQPEGKAIDSPDPMLSWLAVTLLPHEQVDLLFNRIRNLRFFMLDNVCHCFPWMLLEIELEIASDPIMSHAKQAERLECQCGSRFFTDAMLHIAYRHLVNLRQIE